MQPGNPGPGQDPYQQNPYNQYPPGYGQVPQYSDPQYSDPFAPQSGPPYEPQSGSPYPPDYSPSPAQPAEYSLYPPPEALAPPPPQYPVGGYAVPPLQPLTVGSGQGNTFGLLSMIFGIVSIPLLCCLYAGIPVGIAAVVLGIIGVNKANSGEANNKGMSIAGIACGASAAVLGLTGIIAVYGFHVAAPTY
jgi:hypothetical protein